MEFEAKTLAPYAVMPAVSGTAFSGSFSHIFSGGYSAGYYSYKWAEVLEADAFSLFKEKGIFDPATAKAFRNLMEQGGQRHPMDIYVEFRGHEPQPEALVSAMGLK